MFGKSKATEVPEWTVNRESLINNKTSKVYELSNTHTCFNEEKEQISVWYLGKHLATIPCSKKLNGKIFTYYPRCDQFISTDFVFEALDSNDRLWVLEGDFIVALAQKPIYLGGLRFVERDNGIVVYLYGKKQFVFPEADIIILNRAKDSVLDRKHLRLNQKELKELKDNPNDKKKEQHNNPSIGTVKKVMITTETTLENSIEKRIDIVTAEIAFGMNVFKDVFAAFSDFFGGRNQSIQNTLREAKETVLLELKREAIRVGGDAVIAVDLDYSEISGGGKSMLFLVASGTAVKLKKSS